MKRETAEPVWPSATPPRVTTAPDGRVLRWELHDLNQLPPLRADVRGVTAGDGEALPTELRDQLILALDEMASNALRHAGGTPVVVALQPGEDAFLVQVSDGAPEAPPTPAVGRDPSEGGLGLYLVAELALAHGWYVGKGCKHVWALLPRR